MIAKSLKKIFNYLFPPRCVFCLSPSHRDIQLCKDCENELPKINHACKQCGIPLISTQEICGNCLKSKPAFDITLTLFNYLTPIDFAITSLKFGNNLSFAEFFGKILTTYLTKYYANQKLPEIIIPMPLHHSRLRKRGFNQAVEIARIPSKLLQIPLDKFSWNRVKKTLPQTFLSASERKKNLTHAFILKKNFEHKHVAVLDDVITTGTTMNEFCKGLRNAQVEKIDVWCIARTTTHYKK